MFKNITFSESQRRKAWIALNIFAFFTCPTILSFRAHTNKERIKWLTGSTIFCMAIYVFTHVYRFYMDKVPDVFLHRFAQDFVGFGNSTALLFFMCCFIGFIIRFAIDMKSKRKILIFVAILISVISLKWFSINTWQLEDARKSIYSDFYGISDTHYINENKILNDDKAKQILEKQKIKNK
jgi:hypothetical protein